VSPPRLVNHVRLVLGLAVDVEVHDEETKRRCLEHGATREPYGVRFEHADRESMARTLSWLQSAAVPFLDEPAGWPPAAVFDLLREEGLVTGPIRRVSWLGPDDPVITEP
jgi:hypothetical protein